jgi:DNA repair exonuclease SbcCD ATPase subunit
VVDFTDGVNVVIGATDAGKSAIFRALIWVLFNEPNGDEFRSSWGGETEVSVEFTDGTVIRRVKGKKNQYFVNETEFVAFGAKPPEEVYQAHGFDRKLNIQGQADPFFLLQASAGEVARTFNQLANLEKIDTVLASLSSHERQIRAKAKYAEEQLTIQKEALTEFADLDTFGNQLKLATQLQGELNGLRQERTKLDYLLKQIAVNKTALKQFTGLEQALNLADNALGIHSALKTMQTQNHKLKMLIIGITENRQLLRHKKPAITIQKQIEGAISLNADIKTIRHRHESIHASLNAIEFGKRALAQAEIAWNEALQNYEDEFPEECPLCGAMKN